MENNPFVLITDYLEGKLDAEAHARFEAAVRENPELAAELALYRDMYTALTPAPEDAIRKNLELLEKKHTVSDPSFKKWKTPALLLTFLLSGLLVYRLFIHNPVAAPEPVQPPVPGPEKADTIVNDPVTAPEQEKRRPPENQRPAPMAAAFVPNPKLEKMIGNAYRSAARKVKIAGPAADAVLKSANRKTAFTLSGMIETTEKTINEPFRALIFSNDPEAYEKFQFLWNAPLQLEKTNDGFRFSRTETLELPPGLYYLMIESESSGMTYFTGRFKIVR